MDPLRNKQNFDLDKSRQKYHHSLKEHRKISKSIRKLVVDQNFVHYAMGPLRRVYVQHKKTKQLQTISITPGICIVVGENRISRYLQ